MFGFTREAGPHIVLLWAWNMVLLLLVATFVARLNTKHVMQLNEFIGYGDLIEWLLLFNEMCSQIFSINTFFFSPSNIS